MRDNEIVGLWEAYLQVHQPKEEVEQLDEFAPGLQKFVDDATKKGGNILRKIPGVAAALTTGKGGTVTAAQQKAKIKPIKPVGEEVENWVNSLIDEGYDLSEYTWEDMYEMYVNLDEEYDTFDAILEHLVAEGYADTNESALVIMANMSEEWRQSIVEAYDPKGQDKLIKRMRYLSTPDPDSTQEQNKKRKRRAEKMYDIHYTSYVRPKSLPDGFGGPEWKSRKNKERKNKEKSEK